MPTKIYNETVEVQKRAGGTIIAVAVGLLFLWWYIRDIASSAAGDVRTFPAAFHSSPVVTVFFAVLKLAGYLLFPGLALLLLYIPLQNSIFRRVVTGRLGKVEVETRRNNRTTVALVIGNDCIVVRDADNLQAVLANENLIGQELRITLGAFSRVLSIELG